MDEPYLSRFLARRDTSAGLDACWPWMAGLDSGGYGVANVGPKTRDRAHRIAVVLDRRVIPVGMTVDHLCRNRRCANPRHLEVVSRGENVRRGVGRTADHCPKGHPTGPGDRTKRGSCRTCHRISSLARYYRIKNAN